MDKYNYIKTKNNLNSFIGSPFLVVFYFVLFFYLISFVGFGFGNYFVWFSVFVCLISWLRIINSLINFRFWILNFVNLKNIFKIIIERVTIFSRCISLTVRLRINTFMGFILIIGLHFVIIIFSFWYFYLLSLFYELGVIFLQSYILTFLRRIYLIN